MSTRALFAAAFLAAFAAGAAQTVSVKLDIARPSQPFAIPVTEDHDTTVAAQLRSDGADFDPTGWSGVLWVGIAGSVGVSVTNASASVGLMSWDFADDNVPTNGRYSVQIVGIRASDGRTEEWGRGAMDVRINPSKATMPATWAYGEWVYSAITNAVGQFVFTNSAANYPSFEYGLIVTNASGASAPSNGTFVVASGAGYYGDGLTLERAAWVITNSTLIGIYTNVETEIVETQMITTNSITLVSTNYTGGNSIRFDFAHLGAGYQIDADCDPWLTLWEDAYLDTEAFRVGWSTNVLFKPAASVRIMTVATNWLHLISTGEVFYADLDTSNDAEWFYTNATDRFYFYNDGTSVSFQDTGSSEHGIASGVTIGEPFNVVDLFLQPICTAVMDGATGYYVANAWPTNVLAYAADVGGLSGLTGTVARLYGVETNTTTWVSTNTVYTLVTNSLSITTNAATSVRNVRGWIAEYGGAYFGSGRRIHPLIFSNVVDGAIFTAVGKWRVSE